MTTKPCCWRGLWIGRCRDVAEPEGRRPGPLSSVHEPELHAGRPDIEPRGIMVQSGDAVGDQIKRVAVGNHHPLVADGRSELEVRSERTSVSRSTRPCGLAPGLVSSRRVRATAFSLVTGATDRLRAPITFCP